MIRLISTMTVLIIVNVLLSHINPYILLLIDLIIISVMDLIDSLPLKSKYKESLSHSITYQKDDKIIDSLLILAVLILHLLHVQEIGPFQVIFITLALYRFIGVLLFLVSEDSKYLIFFPNFVCDNIILYLIMRYVFHWEWTAIIIVLTLSVPAKIGYEYIHHHLWQLYH